MRPRFVVIVTGVVAAVLAVGLWPGAEPSRAQPPGADVSGAGIHVTTSVENVRVDPPGDRMPNFLMTFAHAVQLSGDYSLNVEGEGITTGQAVAGFLVGCALSLDNGFTVGIDPEQGLLASISPEFSQSNVAATLPSAPLTPVSTPPSATLTPLPTPPSATLTPLPTPQRAGPTSKTPATTSASAATTSASAATTSPSSATTSPSAESTSPSVETTSPSVETTSPSASAPSASLGPTVGGTLGLAEVLEATLAPGQITTVTTATIDLDDRTAFPYHFIFNNAALNVGQCASPVSAVPFITATVGTAVGTVQTSAYGSQFIF
ncbi:MspA family porin [Nocardia xishanensis]|uniref:MspA family porin n=1 Tax=Nocardia xishanensis TaxID=238964 RepID=UPI00342E3A0A